MIIALIGLPGSGKTTIGRYLAKEFGYKWIDVDDHVLEPAWNCTVAMKLSELGSCRFIEEEGNVLLSATKTIENNTVISLTGSNPLVDKTMKALKVINLFKYLVISWCYFNSTIL